MKNIFEKIIDNEIPSYKIYEDEEIIAILDINPLSYGHTLVIPKKRIENFINTNEDISYIVKKVQEISCLLKEKIKSDGITIITNNYYGQDIKHLHFHLIPRYQGDNFDSSFEHKKTDLEEVYKKLKGGLYER